MDSSGAIYLPENYSTLFFQLFTATMVAKTLEFAGTEYQVDGANTLLIVVHRVEAIQEGSSCCSLENLCGSRGSKTQAFSVLRQVNTQFPSFHGIFVIVSHPWLNEEGALVLKCSYDTNADVRTADITAAIATHLGYRSLRIPE